MKKKNRLMGTNISDTTANGQELQLSELVGKKMVNDGTAHRTGRGRSVNFFLRQNALFSLLIDRSIFFFLFSIMSVGLHR